ncbi:MAG: hypothetical protein CGU28_16985 [Candidatus Dactylopiibacterium carminicum]|uniref:Uncharacterized protein n=1 Tax=Candidatus Dactylopiibacterium carminicum TaxID=857335 RepID=A0A272EMK9_9RHOO|nr:hypothetical protein [Candidatus Dactylopiibacterium carminicum]KAF7597721.1 hypothetical protein BGI27_17235 [Candidatus Dactylopiibacterium carminicum]PAS91332.1 MAG: hypothetical protein CGU29_17065 [Candidatus Dactylopiibacterium carminicum]PAS92166.1 MAG: hypothetical protein CGU28_16985 [Candidatus Dactylopiibacterium carminicum]PAS94744.1 MAG: hypothetical protein BSR46_17275 [Candidatus Dactylopiibacterium carminicum]
MNRAIVLFSGLTLLWSASGTAASVMPQIDEAYVCTVRDGNTQQRIHMADGNFYAEFYKTESGTPSLFRKDLGQWRSGPSGGVRFTTYYVFDYAQERWANIGWPDERYAGNPQKLEVTVQGSLPYPCVKHSEDSARLIRAARAVRQETDELLRHNRQAQEEKNRKIRQEVEQEKAQVMVAREIAYAAIANAPEELRCVGPESPPVH